MANSNKVDSVKERNVAVIEWSSGIFTVFWGVWWGFFLDDIFQKSVVAPSPYSFINTGRILLISAVLIAAFVYFYVRWMWALRELYGRTWTRTSLNKLYQILLVWIAFSVVIWLLGSMHSVSLHSITYGIALTFFWFVTMLVILASY